MPIGKIQRKDSDGIWVPKPPDGGWGWVIVLASFAVNFVWGGLFNSYGILYKEFLVYFGQSRGYTSLIGSVVNGLGYGAGIIASALINRYGIRSVAIVGGAIGGVACALCMFADSVLALILLFGGGVGFGHALSYTAAYIIVPYYFEKRRGMATGVAIAGSGIGNIVCAPLMRYLLTECTWRGFVVIQGGLILQCCVFGALFREVPFVRLATIDESKEAEAISETEPMLKDEIEEENEKEQEKDQGAEIQSNGALPFEKISKNQKSSNRSRINSDISEYNSKSEYKRKTHSTVLPPIPETRMAAKERRRLYSQQLAEDDRTFSLDESRLAAKENEKSTRRHTMSKPFLRKDIYYANSLRQLDEYRSNPDLFWQSALSIPRSTQTHEAATIQERNVGANGEGDRSKINRSRVGFFRNSYSRLNDVIGLDLLCKKEFLTFAVAIFFLYFGYYVPYTVLYDFALERGVPNNQAVILVSVMGVANTLGRIVLGSMADLRCVNRIGFFSFIMVLMGISCCFCNFYTNFYVMAVYAAVFAACVGASKAMTLIVTVDLLGLENLTNAFGLLLLFQGFGFVLGNPFAGWLHDLTKSYVMPFSIIGGVLILSGCMIFVSPRMKKRASINSPVVIANEIAPLETRPK